MGAWEKAAELGNLYAMYNLLHFTEYCNSLTQEEQKRLTQLNSKFADQRISDLEFIRLYESAKFILGHPYTRFGTSTLENARALLEQQQKLHGYIVKNKIKDNSILTRVEEVDKEIERRKNKRPTNNK